MIPVSFKIFFTLKLFSRFLELLTPFEAKKKFEIICYLLSCKFIKIIKELSEYSEKLKDG